MNEVYVNHLGSQIQEVDQKRTKVQSELRSLDDQLLDLRLQLSFELEKSPSVAPTSKNK